MNGVKLNVAGLHDLGLAEDLDDADERDEGGVLLEADEVVEERRDDPAHGLREDDVAERLEPAEGRGTGPPRSWLRMDRVDPGPVDLRDVGRIHQGQRDRRAQKNGSFGTPGIRRAGMPKPRTKMMSMPGSAAEEVDVDRREERGPGRRPARAGRAGPRRPGRARGSAPRRSGTAGCSSRTRRGSAAASATKISTLKNVSLDRGPAGRVDDDRGDGRRRRRPSRSRRSGSPSRHPPRCRAGTGDDGGTSPRGPRCPRARHRTSAALAARLGLRPRRIRRGGPPAAVPRATAGAPGPGSSCPAATCRGAGRASPAVCSFPMAAFTQGVSALPLSSTG